MQTALQKRNGILIWNHFESPGPRLYGTLIGILSRDIMISLAYQLNRNVNLQYVQIFSETPLSVEASFSSKANFNRLEEDTMSPCTSS